ncbi:uncharacterized protein G2W53_033311 [Senna tora]|uniref:Uncharacterized protein n=1 Tax=Senna tora TaxID=362788 RepID=A0A834SY03_9FABA|nr:uncharacterized protein G2W53_033311 [Senna tora]
MRERVRALRERGKESDEREEEEGSLSHMPTDDARSTHHRHRH